ncbi:MAG: hypothetical protein R3195_15935 [Gemmatimonadota bacterium]|nr:hypothetical protein [Gemmatimonadota bacterium]
MKNVLQEIHERSLWQVLGLYLASSWLVLQVVDTLESVIGLPAWVPKASVALLITGLPIVMVTAFVQKGWGGGAPERARDGEETGRRVFTWRNALAGGVGAFALLGLGTAAWLGMRAAGIGPAGTLVARGVLDERDVVLLADFSNSTPDEALGRLVTEALRVDLTQSEVVRLAEPGFIDEALTRMQRAPDTPVDQDIAFDMARREGIKAVVAGDVSAAGGAFLLTASVVAPESGEVLVSHRETARDSTRLLDAIDALSGRIRERIGDPLRAIAATPPLEQVTTSNLEALRAFTEAVRLPQADAERRLARLQDAVDADSTFAMAWNALATQLSNYGVEPGRSMAARTRAFELRDNLTERERNFVSSMYYLSVTNEPRNAIPFMEAIVDADPTAHGPINNLGEAYRNIGDLETALDLYHRAIAVDSSMADIPLMNIAQVRATLGDVDSVMAASDLLEVYAPGPFAGWHRAIGYGSVRRYREGEPHLREIVGDLTGNPFLYAQSSQMLGAFVASQGRVAEATQLWTEAGEIMAANGSPAEQVRNHAAIAIMRHAAYHGSSLDALEDGLSRQPLDDLDPVTRPYLDIAAAYAFLGYPDRARETLAAFEASTPQNFRHGFRAQHHGVLGEIALQEGRFEEAIREFRLSASRPQELAPIVSLARAFEAAGQADSARAYYRKFFDAPHWLSALPHSQFLADAFEDAAALEQEAGDLRQAAAYLTEFVNLWADADPGLQPRVVAARERLQAIVDQIG